MIDYHRQHEEPQLQACAGLQEAVPVPEEVHELVLRACGLDVLTSRGSRDGERVEQVLGGAVDHYINIGYIC